MNDLAPSDPPKLGLSLSGGGFRATLFHIGVLRRLAEMDVLRHVSVISTVSGGSITGAHYLLHLKLELEKHGSLTREDYVRIVNNIEYECRRGVARNPRSRLFLNFLRNLKIFCYAEPPGERMASIYQNLFFSSVTRAIAPKAEKRGICLRDMWIKVGIVDIESHNRQQGRERQETDRVPKLILNSSCLNSGREFVFTAMEVGDPRLGFIRMDETALVTDCKRLLARAGSRADRTAALQEFAAAPERGDATGRSAVKNRPDCLEWFVNSGEFDPTPNPVKRSAIVECLAREPEVSRRLFESEFRHLRRAKVAAWYLTDPNVWNGADQRGGYTRVGHMQRFRDAIADIDKELAKRVGVDPKENANEEISADVLEFILCLYYLRSARAFAWDVASGLDNLRLVDATAASANFPPVFTPYHIHDLYDAGTIKVLSLTDGGVHDNLGITVLIDEDCTDMIVSDASGLYREDKSPAGDRIRMMGRIGGMLTAHVRNLQLDGLHDRVDVTKEFRRQEGEVPKDLGYNLNSTAFFHMLSNPSDADVQPSVRPHPHAKLIADVRTDLDVFGTIEIDALIYQGYQLSDRFVRKHLKCSACDLASTAPPHIAKPETGPYAEKVLAAASKRTGRWTAIYKTQWRVIIVAAGVGLLVAMLVFDLSVAHIVKAIGHAICSAVGAVTGKLGVEAASLSRRLWHAYADCLRAIFTAPSPWRMLAFASGVYLLFSDRLERWLGGFLTRRFHGKANRQEQRLKVARFFGPWRRNLTWALWLLPIWIALLGTIVCGVLMLTGVVTRHVTSRVPARAPDPAVRRPTG